ALREAEAELEEYDEAHSLGFVFGQLGNSNDSEKAPANHTPDNEYASHEEWNTQDFIAVPSPLEDMDTDAGNATTCPPTNPPIVKELETSEEEIDKEAQEKPHIQPLEPTSSKLKIFRYRSKRALNVIIKKSKRLKPAMFWTLTAIEVSIVSTLATAPFLV